MKSISNFSRKSADMLGNRFDVTYTSHEICEQCVQVKSWKAKARAEKASKLKTERNVSIHKLQHVKNWEIRRSQIIAVNKTGKLSDANYLQIIIVRTSHVFPYLSYACCVAAYTQIAQFNKR